MDEQLAAFAGLFRVCAGALRKLSLPGRAGNVAVRLEVAAQLETLAATLEHYLDDRGRHS